MLLSATAWSAMSQFPGRIYGNLGFFYTGTQTEEGAKSNSTNTTLSLNLDSYLWRPWFATYNIGGTGSVTKNESAVGDSRVDLLSTHLNFSLLPRSRYPFRLTMSTNDNVDDWLSGEPTVVDFGSQYKSRYLNARQSYITLSGDRVDGWYTRRSRNYSGIDLVDNTFGAKAKVRGKHQNLYANGTYQWRNNSANDNEANNIVGAVTHNYFPTSEFYVKTLLTKTYTDDGTSTANSSIFSNRTTNTDQLSSFFYWRPDYKPYTATGGLRTYRRVADINNVEDTTQIGIDANVAGNYTLTRRLRLTATASGSVLHSTDVSDARNANQSVLLSYRSDRIRYRDIGYYWYANGGFGNKVNIEYDDVETTQSLNASIGHSAKKSWVTGNRSALRVNLTQSATEYLRNNEFDTSLSLSHSASVHWSDEMRKGQFYTQLTALDTRNIDDKTEMQIINFQLSRIVPVNRLSQWGAHLSAQSSRRHSSADDEESFIDGFLTTINGRLNYQHARLFGIYKLKFRTKLDWTSTANRDGGDRKQADWLGRLGYNIGKLSAALITRLRFQNPKTLITKQEFDNATIFFQLNRSF